MPKCEDDFNLGLNAGIGPLQTSTAISVASKLCALVRMRGTLVRHNRGWQREQISQLQRLSVVLDTGRHLQNASDGFMDAKSTCQFFRYHSPPGTHHGPSVVSSPHYHCWLFTWTVRCLVVDLVTVGHPRIWGVCERQLPVCMDARTHCHSL